MHSLISTSAGALEYCTLLYPVPYFKDYRYARGNTFFLFLISSKVHQSKNLIYIHTLRLGMILKHYKNLTMMYYKNKLGLE
jgi:hypothetical protein